MNLIWHTAIFVALGTVLVTSVIMGLLLLVMNLQGEPKEDRISSLPMKINSKRVTFEVDGKRVNLRIDVSDADVPGARTSHVGI